MLSVIIKSSSRVHVNSLDIPRNTPLSVSPLFLPGQNLDTCYTARNPLSESKFAKSIGSLSYRSTRKHFHYFHMTFYNYLQSQSKIFFGKPFIPYLWLAIYSKTIFVVWLIFQLVKWNLWLCKNKPSLVNLKNDHYKGS